MDFFFFFFFEKSTAVSTLHKEMGKKERKIKDISTVT